MPAAVVWGLRLALGGLGLSALWSVEDVSEEVRKAAPWVAAGLALYIIAKRVR